MKKDVSAKLNKLNLPNDILNKSIDNEISTIEEMWKLGRRDLKNMGFSNDEINTIIIKLQLYGLDLNKKTY